MMLSVACEFEALMLQAEALAARLGIPFDNTAQNQLVLTPEKWMLKIKPFLPLYADFSRKTWQKRRDAGKQQGLVRACKPAPGKKILDATAGWGRDAAVLASFGSELLLLERNPVMAVLLRDALLRQDRASASALKISLCENDALNYLEQLSPEAYPHVIYLDPMHPERQKSALVKKELQVLQQLIGPDLDVFELISLAKMRVLEKVVVKWPQNQPPVLAAQNSIEGKTVRFDIYYP